MTSAAANNIITHIRQSLGAEWDIECPKYANDSYGVCASLGPLRVVALVSGTSQIPTYQCSLSYSSGETYLLKDVDTSYQIFTDPVEAIVCLLANARKDLEYRTALVNDAEKIATSFVCACCKKPRFKSQ